MNFPRHTTLEQSIQFAERCVHCWEDGSAYPWAVMQRTTGEFLGCVELRVRPPQADFGYIFCEPFWGRGFASEAVQPIVDWAFEQPTIYRVWATCCPENIGSARVLSKTGLKPEATLENWEARPQLGKAAGPSLMYAKIKPVTPRS
jgi:ribosomal-protein-alanine N-acetyltransferase